jgi:hypothetical protein
MSKTFTHAGTCFVDGVACYKFANDANRAAVLTKLGATDVNIVALPAPMDKDAAIAYLATLGITADKVKIRTKSATVTVKVKAKVKAPALSGDDAMREAWAEAMAEREATGLMPTMTFAQWKRGTEKWNKWTAEIDARLEAKRATGKTIVPA